MPNRPDLGEVWWFHIVMQTSSRQLLVDWYVVCTFRYNVGYYGRFLLLFHSMYCHGGLSTYFNTATEHDEGCKKRIPALEISERLSKSATLPLIQAAFWAKKYGQLIDLLYTLTQSEWWKRVCTWQEMALPFGGVRLLSETRTHVSRSNTVAVDKLVYNFEGAVKHVAWHL